MAQVTSIGKRELFLLEFRRGAGLLYGFFVALGRIEGSRGSRLMLFGFSPPRSGKIQRHLQCVPKDYRMLKILSRCRDAVAGGFRHSQSWL